MVLNVRADRSLIRAEARSRRFVQVGIQAPEAPAREKRTPVNLAFVIDRSGSMDGEKIARARQAVIAGLHALRSEDRFAVVAYDDAIETVVASTLATPEARAEAERAVRQIGARNSTDLCAGWQRGCAEVGANRDTQALGRCLLLTDGLANAGIRDVETLVTLAADTRARGISTSTFGIGGDFDEVLLRRMSEAGGGNFQYVQTAAQIPDFIASEVGEALEITVRDAVIVVEAGPGVEAVSLNDFPCRQDGEAWRVELGSLYSGQLLQAVVRLRFSKGDNGASRTVRIRLEDREHALGRAEASLVFTWAGNAENDAQPRERSVDRLVAVLYGAAAERQALERNREHDLKGAAALVERCARHIEGYAGDDPALRALAADLREKVQRYSVDMDGLSRKLAYWGAQTSLKGRAMEAGRRRRGAAQGIVLLPLPQLLDAVRLASSHLQAADPAFSGLVVDEWLDHPLRPFDSAVLDPAQESELLAQCAQGAPNAVLRIAFTAQRLCDNWFSHWHDAERTAVVSLAGWSARGPVPAEAFVAYEIALHGLRSLGSGWTPERLMHEESRGCLFDFCGERSEIERKLQAAGLCRPCLEALQREGGVDIDQVRRVAEAIRSLAVPAGVVH